MKSHRVPKSACSKCGSPLDGATGATTESMPEPGNLSVCIRCGNLQCFADDLSLRDLTNDELADVMRDPELAALIFRMRRTIQEVKP